MARVVRITQIAVWSTLLLLTSVPADADDMWAFGPFIRLEHENPVLEPRSDTSFHCPMQGRRIRWEEKDVFNPSAVVKDGQVQLIYRAEDTVVSKRARPTSRHFPTTDHALFPSPHLSAPPLHAPPFRRATSQGRAA